MDLGRDIRSRSLFACYAADRKAKSAELEKMRKVVEAALSEVMGDEDPSYDDIKTRRDPRDDDDEDSRSLTVNIGTIYRLFSSEPERRAEMKLGPTILIPTGRPISTTRHVHEE